MDNKDRRETGRKEKMKEDTEKGRMTGIQGRMETKRQDRMLRDGE